MAQKREELKTKAKLAFQQERYEDSKNMMKELVEVILQTWWLFRSWRLWKTDLQQKRETCFRMPTKT